MEASKRQREAGFKDIIGEPPSNNSLSAEANEDKKIDATLGSPQPLPSPSDNQVKDENDSDSLKKEDKPNHSSMDLKPAPAEDMKSPSVTEDQNRLIQPGKSPSQEPESPRGGSASPVKTAESNSFSMSTTLQPATCITVAATTSAVPKPSDLHLSSSSHPLPSASPSSTSVSSLAATPAPTVPPVPSESATNKPKEKRRVSLADYKRRRKNTNSEGTSSTPNSSAPTTPKPMPSKTPLMFSHPLTTRSVVSSAIPSSVVPPQTPVTVNHVMEDGGTPTQDEQLGSNSSSGPGSAAPGMALSSVTTTGGTIAPTLSTLPLFEKLQKLEQAQKENKKKGKYH